MTCKDCIHYGICHLQYMRGEKYKDVELSECSDFKDKSKYIELPRKVGDTVYILIDNQIKPISIENLVIILYCIFLRDEQREKNKKKGTKMDEVQDD